MIINYYKKCPICGDEYCLWSFSSHWGETILVASACSCKNKGVHKPMEEEKIFLENLKMETQNALRNVFDEWNDNEKGYDCQTKKGKAEILVQVLPENKEVSEFIKKESGAFVIPEIWMNKSRADLFVFCLTEKQGMQLIPISGVEGINL